MVNGIDLNNEKLLESFLTDVRFVLLLAFMTFYLIFAFLSFIFLSPFLLYIWFFFAIMAGIMLLVWSVDNIKKALLGTAIALGNAIFIWLPLAFWFDSQRYDFGSIFSWLLLKVALAWCILGGGIFLISLIFQLMKFIYFKRR
jgi:hypothetical protein